MARGNGRSKADRRQEEFARRERDEQYRLLARELWRTRPDDDELSEQLDPSENSSDER